MRTTLHRTRSARLSASIAGFEHRFLAVNGARLHYVESGRGPAALLLVGGWPQSWYVWRKVLPLLRAALPQRRLVAIDLPGQGDSDAPSAYDMRTIAGYVRGLVDALALPRFDYVGHDIGMWVGYRFACDHAERLATLAVMDAAIPGLSPPSPFVQRSWHFAFNQLPELPEALTAGRERVVLAWRAKHLSRVPGAITDADLDEYARVYERPGAMSRGFEFYRAIPVTAQQNIESAKTPLALPVLAIGGAEGVGQIVLDTMRKVATDVRGLLYEGCGHHVPEEMPERVVRDVLEHIGHK
jgi:pimeloyl-ACP methyl ester carboxylesterase